MIRQLEEDACTILIAARRIHSAVSLHAPARMATCCPEIKRSVYYGDICEDSWQCRNTLGIFGECRDHVCLCRLGYHFMMPHCKKSQKLNELCGDWQDCFIGEGSKHAMDCIDGICVCRRGCSQGNNTCDSCECCCSSASIITDGLFPFIIVILLLVFTVCFTEKLSIYIF